MKIRPGVLINYINLNLTGGITLQYRGQNCAFNHDDVIKKAELEFNIPRSIDLRKYFDVYREHNWDDSVHFKMRFNNFENLEFEVDLISRTVSCFDNIYIFNPIGRVGLRDLAYKDGIIISGAFIHDSLGLNYYDNDIIFFSAKFSVQSSNNLDLQKTLDYFIKWAWR